MNGPLHTQHFWSHFSPCSYSWFFYFVSIPGKRSHCGALGGHQLPPVQSCRPLWLCPVSTQSENPPVIIPDNLMNNLWCCHINGEQRKWEAGKAGVAEERACLWPWEATGLQHCATVLYIGWHMQAGNSLVSHNHRATVLKHKEDGETVGWWEDKSNILVVWFEAVDWVDQQQGPA